MLKCGLSKTILPDILHIEGCNFIDKPMGGQLTFSRQLMKAFGNRLALVGWTSNTEDPIGRWFDKKFDGITYRFFAISVDKKASIKSFLPARLKTWFQIKRYQKDIFSIGIPNIIVREHTILMAIKTKPDDNLCYYFPGVEPPLSVARYWWAKYFSSFFDSLFFQSLGKKTSCILAAADETAIIELEQRAGKLLKGKKIVSFPTRVDTNIFHGGDRLESRRKLGLPRDEIVVATTGRIHWAKGWPLLLESYKLFLDRFPKSLLIFLGDGDDRMALIEKAAALGIHDRVIITGYQPQPTIADYLRALNLFVMGSLKEGWSTALVEALACNVPIVTTRFSSADTIVKHGVNGFVVERNPTVFAEAMKNALSLTEVTEYSKNAIQRYALKNLGQDLLNVWKII